MIIVILKGGLGNQMFQYAAGRRLAKIHKTTLKLDLTFLLDQTPRKNFVYRDYDLNIFNIQENFATPDGVGRFKKKYNSKIIRLIFEINLKIKGYKIIREPYFHFYKNLLNAPDNVYLKGYWQSEKYFKDIEQIIRKEFTFKSGLSKESKRLADKISSLNSVCLNIRRCDFVRNPYHGVVNLDYINKSVKIIADKVNNPYFFIFSDDIEWCENNIHLDYPLSVVTHNYAGEKFKDYLHLMILCKHYIIPNSTFGWWGAWLNNNPDKIVIAPQKWFNNPSIDTKDLILESWIRI